MFLSCLGTYVQSNTFLGCLGSVSQGLGHKAHVIVLWAVWVWGLRIICRDDAHLNAFEHSPTPRHLLPSPLTVCPLESPSSGHRCVTLLVCVQASEMFCGLCQACEVFAQMFYMYPRWWEISELFWGLCPWYEVCKLFGVLGLTMKGPWSALGSQGVRFLLLFVVVRGKRTRSIK